MKNFSLINSYKCEWMCYLLLLLLFVSFISCKKMEHKNQITAELPIGTWRVIDLKSPDKNIVFDTATTYFVEHLTKNKIMILAEDNGLSGEFIVVNKDSFKIENIAVTDVCCNSEDAKMLFKFFYGKIKQKQLGNKLILSSNKTVVTLEKQMK